MLATECYRRGSDGATPRVFVDITTSLMLAGKQPIGISRVEGEVARRLLQFSNLNCIPVVFRNDGVLFALSPEQVALIFSAKPIADSQENHLGKRDSSLLATKCDAAVAKERKAQGQPWSLPTRLKLMIATRLRYAARAFVFCMPWAVREDVRAILIHAQRIARTIVYGHHAGSVAAPILAHSILPTLRMVVHTRSGDVLWIASLYGNFVPLRTIAEMHAQSGLRVVTSCYCVTHPQSNPSSMGAELFMADAVALLDSSDIVLTISERTRRELLALAARLEREAPAVQVLQTDSGLRQLPDLDHKESPNATVAQTVMQPNLEIALPDPPLWDEVAAAVEERLQMLVAETDAG